jgi:hypothetical protein
MIPVDDEVKALITASGANHAAVGLLQSPLILLVD